jgi:hypothetical protein
MSIGAAAFKGIKHVLVLAGLLLGLAASASADTLWTLSDVTFDNGNSAVGTFTTDDAVTQILSFSIAITGPASGAAFTAAQMVDAYLPGTVGIANSDFSKYVDLYLASNLTSAGGFIAFTEGYDCPGCGTLILNADTGVNGVVVTPEPATGAFMLLGFGMMIRKRIAQRRQRVAEINLA